MSPPVLSVCELRSDPNVFVSRSVTEVELDKEQQLLNIANPVLIGVVLVGREQETGTEVSQLRLVHSLAECVAILHMRCLG